MVASDHLIYFRRKLILVEPRRARHGTNCIVDQRDRTVRTSYVRQVTLANEIHDIARHGAEARHRDTVVREHLTDPAPVIELPEALRIVYCAAQHRAAERVGLRQRGAEQPREVAVEELRQRVRYVRIAESAYPLLVLLIRAVEECLVTAA